MYHTKRLEQNHSTLKARHNILKIVYTIFVYTVGFGIVLSFVPASFFQLLDWFIHELIYSSSRLSLPLAEAANMRQRYQLILSFP